MMCNMPVEGPMNGSRPLKSNELYKIIKAATNPRDKCLVLFGVATGFRIAEILSIRISDIATPSLIPRTSIHLKVKSKKRTKDGKPKPTKYRGCALGDSLRMVISDWIEKHPSPEPDSHLFCRQHGDPREAITPQHANRILKQLCDSAGVDPYRISSHSLRKTYAKQANEDFGGDLIKVQKAMAHASIASTQHYLETMDEDLEQFQLGALDKFLNGHQMEIFEKAAEEKPDYGDKT